MVPNGHKVLFKCPKCTQINMIYMTLIQNNKLEVFKLLQQYHKNRMVHKQHKLRGKVRKMNSLEMTKIKKNLNTYKMSIS